MPLPDSQPEDSISALPDEQILLQLRADVLSGAYYLVDYRGYAGYAPGDNVVHIFSMGSNTTEALIASEKLLTQGIYANVIVVTSPDLLVGNLGALNEYHHLRNTLQINAKLFVKPIQNGHLEPSEVVTLSGRRVPIVSVHDGEPGLLDNIGSIVGVRHECLAVRKHSKCGRPNEIYEYHHIDSESVIEACGKVLSETALESVHASSSALNYIVDSENNETKIDWRALWGKSSH
jgi:pyruvate dehydrogenase E1 component